MLVVLIEKKRCKAMKGETMDIAEFPMPVNEKEAEAVLARIVEQIKEVRQQMQTDDKDIARLKAESAELRNETREILARLQNAFAV